MNATIIPKVSVITIVFNGAEYIERTIQSVVHQTYSNIEYIIIDGGSTDNTMEIVRRYLDKISIVVSEPDGGIYDAMNKGMRLATGDWINFLNGGDYFYDENVVASILNSASDADFIYGDSINIAPGFQKLIKPVQISRETLKQGLGICHQALFVKRDIAPPYDLSFRYKAEYNWVIDLLHKSPSPRIRYVSIPIVFYSLGGFSEKGVIKNLREFLSITYSRFGFFQVIKNTPFYLFIYLRHLKYKIFGYGHAK